MGQSFCPRSKKNMDNPWGWGKKQLVASHIKGQEYLPRYLAFVEAFSLHSKCNSNKIISGSMPWYHCRLLPKLITRKNNYINRTFNFTGLAKFTQGVTAFYLKVDMMWMTTAFPAIEIFIYRMPSTTEDLVKEMMHRNSLLIWGSDSKITKQEENDVCFIQRNY
jgi:hypothetical protein